MKKRRAKEKEKYSKSALVVDNHVNHQDEIQMLKNDIE
tara:strand:- start:247 stop:360 length:114 start_codon:yes stop_codon:yes gene_type:complete